MNSKADEKIGYAESVAKLIKESERKQKKAENDNTIKLGIVVLGDYRNFNQRLEDEINQHFKAAKITEIRTTGNQGCEYVLHFARKNNIPYTVWKNGIPFITRKKECYFDDNYEFDYSGCINYLVYGTDALLLFNNDERSNTFVWLILYHAKMTREDFVLINDVTSPDYSKEEKELMDLMASLAGKFPDYEMRELFFKLNRQHLKAFVKYMQTGEKMDIKRVLFRLSELYIKGEKYNRRIADTPDRNEDFWIADSLIKKVLAFQTGKTEEEISENYAEIMKTEINPKFPDDNVFADFTIRLSSLARDPWLDLDYCMNILLPEYRDDDEMCAAVCYGEWLRFKAAFSPH
jgi:hypothetical protein